MNPLRLIVAKEVVPMRGGPIRDGAVLCRGETIVAVGPVRTLREQNPNAEVLDLGKVVLLPGLVNAHTHLELSRRPRGPRPEGFAQWIGAMAEAGRAAGPPAEWVEGAARAGAIESLAAGVTCVGDITAHPLHSRAGISSTALRAVSFAELLGLGGAQPRFDAALVEAERMNGSTGRIQSGLSPHAPYTVDETGFRATLAAAARLRWPVATHLAESLEESQFVREANGPFRALWERLGQWRGNVAVGTQESPVQLAARVGLLERTEVLLAHVNYATAADLDLLAGGKASVVFCPQTHAWFDHPPHGFVEMLRRGINVCVGTDSRASSATLNPLADLAIIRSDHGREAVSTRTLWSLVTRRPAAPLGLAGRLGELVPGAFADLVGYPRLAEDVDEALEAIIADRPASVAVFVGGEAVEASGERA